MPFLPIFGSGEAATPSTEKLAKTRGYYFTQSETSPVGYVQLGRHYPRAHCRNYFYYKRSNLVQTPEPAAPPAEWPAYLFTKDHSRYRHYQPEVTQRRRKPFIPQEEAAVVWPAEIFRKDRNRIQAYYPKPTLRTRHIIIAVPIPEWPVAVFKPDRTRYEKMFVRGPWIQTRKSFISVSTVTNDVIVSRPMRPVLVERQQYHRSPAVISSTNVTQNIVINRPQRPIMAAPPLHKRAAPVIETTNITNNVVISRPTRMVMESRQIYKRRLIVSTVQNNTIISRPLRPVLETRVIQKTQKVIPSLNVTTVQPILKIPRRVM